MRCRCRDSRSFTTIFDSLFSLCICAYIHTHRYKNNYLISNCRSLAVSPQSIIHLEIAAVDASQIEELESILTEALALQSQLIEKKEHLRRSLAVISDKLQK
uniref:Si:dkey-40g16.5 n=1 Tax=Electrophorus electricus TaxID=8005 RepID=A0A4W4GDJ6_ELEEL